MIWRNFFFSESKFLFFHTVLPIRIYVKSIFWDFRVSKTVILSILNSISNLTKPGNVKYDIGRKILKIPHCAQKFLLTPFWQKFRESTFLLMSWFHEKFWEKENVSFFHAVTTSHNYHTMYVWFYVTWFLVPFWLLGRFLILLYLHAS